MQLLCSTNLSFQLERLMMHWTQSLKDSLTICLLNGVQSSSIQKQRKSVLVYLDISSTIKRFNPFLKTLTNYRSSIVGWKYYVCLIRRLNISNRYILQTSVENFLKNILKRFN